MDVMQNELWFPHFHGQLYIKKLGQDNKLHCVTWNIETLIGKLEKGD